MIDLSFEEQIPMSDVSNKSVPQEEPAVEEPAVEEPAAETVEEASVPRTGSTYNAGRKTPYSSPFKPWGTPDPNDTYFDDARKSTKPHPPHTNGPKGFVQTFPAFNEPGVAAGY